MKLPETKQKRRPCAVAFGREVRAARLSAGMRQEAAAREVGLSVGQLGRVECGKEWPKKATRVGILALLRAVPSAGGEKISPNSGNAADFACPACGGSHFGRDTEHIGGEVVVLPTVLCHAPDCGWRGVWPAQASRLQKVRKQGDRL